MTDTEIVRACGEAMGWTTGDPASSHWRGLGYYADGKRVASADWNPLTNDADWVQVLDEFAKQGFRPGLGFGPTIGPSDRWYIEWMPLGEKYMVGVDFPPTPEGRRRVVCIAFLKARGQWREEK